MAENEEMGLEISMQLSMDSIAKVAGGICVELLRQSQELEYVDSEGNRLETSLDSIAMNANRLAWICCTGQIPS